MDKEHVTNPRIVVIGAGMAGILAAIKLREAGYDDFVIYEKADRLGGTWRENEYPGLTCDVPSHLYSYSFAPNPDWSRLFAPGAEIQAYFADVARRFGVEPSIRYRKEIASCRFVGGRWRIESTDGARDEADFVIAATGVLHHPNVPDLPGLGGGLDRLDGAIGKRRIDRYLEFDLRYEADRVFRAPVELGMAPLAAMALDLGDGNALDTNAAEGLADLLELMRLDDSYDVFHPRSPLADCNGALQHKNRARFTNRDKLLFYNIFMESRRIGK